MKASTLKFAVLVYLAGMVVIHAALFWNLRDSIRKGYSDFTIYYCAGTMVRRGLGHLLYDGATQFKIQREFSPEVEIRLGPLPYNHPAFEALLFAPLTYVPYVVAFTFWDLANLAMLAALPFLLRPQLNQLQGYAWPLWVLAGLGFFPIFVGLLQGQDAILLLFLYVLAFVCLRQRRDVLAGGWLALGLFKPHLVLPFVLLLMLQGRKKVLYGFIPTAVLLALVSAAIVGWEGMMSYPRYVVHLEDTAARGAIVPADMPNLRGILYSLLHGGPRVGAVTLGLSIGVLLFAAWQCRTVSPDDVFNLKVCLAVGATIIVSYHLLIYDLSLLMLPLPLLANELRGRLRGWPQALTVAAFSTLFFSPGLILLMRDNQLAWMGWAVILLTAGIAGQISLRIRRAGEAV
jgi:Glycosyltransferase family 87